MYVCGVDFALSCVLVHSFISPFIVNDLKKTKAYAAQSQEFGHVIAQY